MATKIVAERKVPTLLLSAMLANVDVMSVRPFIRAPEVRVNEIEVAKIDVGVAEGSHVLGEEATGRERRD